MIDIHGMSNPDAWISPRLRWLREVLPCHKCDYVDVAKRSSVALPLEREYLIERLGYGRIGPE